MSDIKKVYVSEKNRVTIICPECGNVKVEDAEQFKGAEGDRNIDITCEKCNAQIAVFIDFRRYYRKSVSLQGIIHKPDGKFCKITIENLSRSGVGFTLEDTFSVEMDEELDVQFTLDDEDKTFIRKKAVVRYIRDNVIGAEFTEFQKFSKELGFYLKHPG